MWLSVETMVRGQINAMEAQNKGQTGHMAFFSSYVPYYVNK